MISCLKKDEKGVAVILEYTLILPLVMVVMFVLIFTGFILHEKAVMESATARGAIYISKSICDPNYTNIVKIERNANNDPNEISMASIASIKNDPYRYLFDINFSAKDLSGESDVVSSIIKRNQIFMSKEPQVTITETGIAFKKITITATQEYDMPKLLPGFNLPPIVTITTESESYINEPAEFIRNADYSIQIVKKAASAMEDKLSSSVGNKIVTITSKITSFIGKFNSGKKG